ncbi:unnamed protein product [Lupinus luteus]|uniref:Uncharacterized protein n=1 Tax=Lupinus luteus TaxID=3873 RepID=A0AAV1XF15_LUPLU
MEAHMQCDLKAKERYEAWISLNATNEQLEATQMALDKVTFKSISIDQTLEKQAENLRSISNRYELDKKKWQQSISPCSCTKQIRARVVSFGCKKLFFFLGR